MKCPHCSANLSLFSSEIRSFRSDKVCPHCYEPIRLTVNYKMGFMVFVPAIIVIILLDPFLQQYGFSGSFMVGILAGMAAMLTLTVSPRKAKPM